MGSIQVVDGDKILKVVNLIAAENVEKPPLPYFLNGIWICGYALAAKKSTALWGFIFAGNYSKMQNYFPVAQQRRGQKCKAIAQKERETDRQA